MNLTRISSILTKSRNSISNIKSGIIGEMYERSNDLSISFLRKSRIEESKRVEGKKLE